MARCIMVQGTMSGAGKSLFVTALCRIFRQDGYRVAPFKSQNMALNSYITRDNLEMGRAQVVQAEAAGIEPDVRMNPILLKPSSDTGSQVIVMGEVRGHMSAREYFANKRAMIPEIMEAYESLAEENDIIVIEGAGSPAEINLRENDIVNMGLAELVNAPVILVGDIDRGGVFAQLYGTTELVTPEEKARIEGTVINKFRGDIDLLMPGIEMIEQKSGVRCLGAVPYVHVDIDDEDSLAPVLSKNETHAAIDIACISLPRISNFTDLSPLEAHPALGVRYVRTASELGQPDMIVLPGTKSTADDLVWLRESGIEASILLAATAGTPVFGICGGYQMMGEKLVDPEHVESKLDEIRGLGLLPVVTSFEADKRRTRVRASIEEGPFKGVKLDCYEIHMGRSEVRGKAFCILEDGTEDGCTNGDFFGTYMHGLFDTGELTEKLANYLAERKGISIDDLKPSSRREYVESQYDILADAVRRAIDMNEIYAIMGKYE